MRIAILLASAALLLSIHLDTDTTCGDDAQCRVALEAGGPTN